MNLPQVPADKAQHFCYGAAVAAVAFIASTLSGLPGSAPMAAVAAAAVAGAAKEAIDYALNHRAHAAGLMKPHSVSVGDFVATVLGGVAVGAF